MPDPFHQTLSATEVPALFGISPWITRWMLLRKFIYGDVISGPGDNRMDWGLRLQPLVLKQAAEDLHLEVAPDEQYVRHGLVGCTRDAIITCPDRGPGALETKCVFDYGSWMREWDGGKSPPKNYETQLQVQMLVGDGVKSYDWGVLAAWVCGEMHYFERKPIPELWDEIVKEAAKFFEDVAAKLEGEPFGDPIEVPLLNRLFAPKPGVVVDLTTREDAHDLVTDAQLLSYYSGEARSHAKAAEKIKAKFKGLIGDAEEATLPYGVKIKAKQTSRAGYTVKPTKFTTIDVFIPDSTPAGSEPPAPVNILAGA